jgi:hypothetical protein
VNNVHLLTLRLHEQPEDDALRAALTDALVEDEGITHPEAAGRVAAITRAVIDARQLAEAAHLLSEVGEDAPALHRLILRTANVPASPAPTVIVVTGDTAPVFSVHHGHAWWNPVRTGLVTVGAGWVVAAARRRAHNQRRGGRGRRGPGRRR